MGPEISRLRETRRWILHTLTSVWILKNSFIGVKTKWSSPKGGGSKGGREERKGMATVGRKKVPFI